MDRSPILVRTVLALALIAGAGACGGSDDESSSTTIPAVETTIAPTTVPATTAPPTTVAPTTVAPTTTPPTTTPPTTVPPTTVPPTTVPPTTAPPTTTPPTTVPGDVDLAMAQFCFDSEQVYVFDRVTAELDAPTPAQAEAALSVLMFTVSAAIDSAPPGFEAQPERMLVVLTEINALYARFDFDVDAMLASPDNAEINEPLDEYEQLIKDLAEFLEDECGADLAILDSQAVKLAPIIDQIIDWPLRPIANQAGDIRLFVPLEWAEWIGTVEPGPFTALQASTSIDQFETTWNVSGVLATVGYVGPDAADLPAVLELATAVGDCVAETSEPYADAVYTGELHLFSQCGGVDTDAAVLVATDAANSVEIALEFQFAGGYDRVVLNQMLAGFAAGA